ncbi:MAG: hypothetical protein V7603_1952 [Micromonosporaceae bacterium]
MVPRFIGAHDDPILMTAPARPRAALIVLHAPGENRTGNGYLFASLARTLTGHGVATARFDLSGFGESLGPPGVQIWDNQCLGALSAVRRELPGVPVHWLARGASAALLPADGTEGNRMALSPPLPEELRRLADLADPEGHVIGRASPPADEAGLWAWLGADPTLVGGLVLEADHLQDLALRLADPRWDTELGPADRQPRVLSRIVVSEEDPLVRLEAARIGLISLVADYLEG